MIICFSHPAEISPWEMGSKISNGFWLALPFLSFILLGNAYVSAHKFMYLLFASYSLIMFIDKCDILLMCVCDIERALEAKEL